MKTMRVRPVLVETTDKSRICHLTPKGIEYKDLRFLEIECPIINDSINYDIILISLDYCANIGDMYYDEHNNLVLKATEYTDHKVNLYKRVIANQRLFTDELTENLVEEYNNGGMNDFDIKMTTNSSWKEVRGTLTLPDTEEVRACRGFIDSFNIDTDFVYTELLSYDGNKPYPLLIHGYISPEDYVYKQDECIGFIDGHETKQSENLNLYTEADVLKLLTKFKNSFGLYRGIQVLDSDIHKWFELIKKK